MMVMILVYRKKVQIERFTLFNTKRALPFKCKTFFINIKHRLINIDFLFIVKPAIRFSKNPYSVPESWLPCCQGHK